MVRAWYDLPDEIFMRNAGYDHFIVAGTCHPFNICSTMECDVTIYHPFAGNVMVLSGGIREYGHPDKLFAPAAAYPMLRHIFVPFPVRLDCPLLEHLCRPGHGRPIAVSFVGSENSRIRHDFRVEMNKRNFERGPDPRLFVRVLEDDLE